MKTTTEDLNLLEPFWKGETSHREGLFFIQESDGEAPAARLFFPPARIVFLRSASGEAVYDEGKDYRVDAAARRILLPAGSSIPFMRRREMYLPAGSPNAISHRLGDPDTFLVFGEGNWFHRRQAEVTYTHMAGLWRGFVPPFAGQDLPAAMARLKSRAPLTLCVLGDSIAAGGNASLQVPPFQPAFPELFALGLERVFGSKVTVTNLAKGGTTAEYGVEVAPLAAAGAPHLVLVAFGMNDVSRQNALQYQGHIARIIQIVRAQSPAAEFILVAPMRANPEWAPSPAEEFPRHRDALAGLCGRGAALADLTSLYAEILRHKNYHDLTGNGVNHANDFGHRLYAQGILSLVVAGVGAPQGA
jgi:lysophospholipase L1-like esterase